MQFSIIDWRREGYPTTRDVTLGAAAADATVAELLAALYRPVPGGGLDLDGLPVSAHTRISDLPLRAGSMLTLWPDAPPPPAADPPAPLTRLTQVAGPDCGLSVGLGRGGSALGPGRLGFGPGRGARPAVRIEVAGPGRYRVEAPGDAQVRVDGQPPGGAVAAARVPRGRPVTPAGGRDATGVGLCLGTAGAVLAVVRQNPLRLAAVASVAWPVELWRPDPPPHDAMSAGRRVLAQARRRLGLRRWCPVAVVAGPSLPSGGTPDWVPPRSAELLARAGLAQGWVIAPDWAAAVRAAPDLVVAAELAAATAGPEAGLAVGAAIATLQPPEPGRHAPGTGWSGTAGSTPDRADVAGAGSDGWAVQPTDGNGPVVGDGTQ